MDYSRHAETLRRMAVQYQQMVEAADAFDTVAQSDAMLTAIKRQTDEAKAALDKASSDVIEANAVLEQVKEASTRMLREADEQATAKVRTAEATADDWMKRAKEKAAQYLDGERERVAAKLKTINAETAAAQAKLADLLGQIEVAERAAKEADERAKNSKAILDTLLAQARKMASL